MTTFLQPSHPAPSSELGLHYLNAVNGSHHLASSLGCGGEKGQDASKDREEERMPGNRDLKLEKSREQGLRAERAQNEGEKQLGHGEEGSSFLVPFLVVTH